MPMCSRPGCVAQAVSDGFCPVHATRAGKACETCRGTGSHFYSGQGLTMACQRCGGTGLKDSSARQMKRRPEDDPVEKRGLIQAANE